MIKSKIKNIICEFKNYFSSHRKYIFIFWLLSCIFIFGFTLAYNEKPRQNTISKIQAYSQNTKIIESNSSITPVVAALTGSAITALAAIYAMHQQIKSVEKREYSKNHREKLEVINHELLSINDRLIPLCNSYSKAISQINHNENQIKELKNKFFAIMKENSMQNRISILTAKILIYIPPNLKNDYILNKDIINTLICNPYIKNMTEDQRDFNKIDQAIKNYHTASIEIHKFIIDKLSQNNYSA